MENLYRALMMGWGIFFLLHCMFGYHRFTRQCLIASGVFGIGAGAVVVTAIATFWLSKG